MSRTTDTLHQRMSAAQERYVMARKIEENARLNLELATRMVEQFRHDHHQATLAYLHAVIEEN